MAKKRVIEVERLTKVCPGFPSYFDEGDPLRLAAYEGFGVSQKENPRHPTVTALQHDWCWLTKSMYRNGWGVVAALVQRLNTVYVYAEGGGADFTTDNGTRVVYSGLKQILMLEPEAIVDVRERPPLTHRMKLKGGAR